MSHLAPAHQVRAVAPRSTWTLWLHWILATAICGVVGWLLPTLSMLLLFPQSYNYTDDNAIGPLIVSGCGWILLIGILVGFGQVLVLFRNVKGCNWRGWLPFTALAEILIAVVLLLSQRGGLYDGSVGLPALLRLAIAGAIAGICQGIVLSSYIRRAWSWILANLVALPISLLIGELVVRIFLPTPLYEPALFTPDAEVRAETFRLYLVGWSAGAVAFSVITGGALAWLVCTQGIIVYENKR